MRGNTASEVVWQTEKIGGKVMTNYAKRLGIAILIALATVLMLVSASAASAVWGG
jgi:hypothetical protein